MTSAAQLIAVAQSQVGVVETGGSSGHNGNIQPYAAELEPSLLGQPWCATWVSWVFKHAGVPLPAIDRPYGFIYCPDGVNYAKRNGLWDASGHYAPGDIVLYQFSGSLSDHTGIVVSDDGVNIRTIEGNTSAGNVGSQTNGGMVAARIRPHGPSVLGVLKASRWLTADATPAPATPPAAPAPAVGGPTADRNLTAGVQRALHVAADGRWGNQTDAAGNLVRTAASGNQFPDPRGLQRAVGATPDGKVGPLTRGALHTCVQQIQVAIGGGLVADGAWGPRTDARWQVVRTANLNKF